MKRIITIISEIYSHANRLIIKELEGHELSGLVPSHGNILILLYQNEEGISMSKITSSINKNKSTVTTLVNKLEKMGLVEKVKNALDSRSTIIKLTKKGKETKPIVIDEISTKLLNRTYKDFSQEEKEKIIDLLERIKNNLLD